MGSMDATVVDPWTRRMLPARITWNDGILTGVEPLPRGEVDGNGFVLPGFVDAHVHVESSMIPPVEFARMAVVHGTIGTVSDPHEIANVLGVAGVEFMLAEAAQTPFRFCFGAPSCVPATTFETAGAVLDANDVADLLRRPEIGYLAEVMNFPGVIAGDPDLLKKIAAAVAAGKPVDGHSPGLRGAPLKAYAAAGITTDHECASAEEAAEKLACGMKILIREGSAARNFDALVDLLRAHPKDLMFCSDDKHPDSLAVGHIDRLAARAVSAGHDLFDVLRAACVNPVEHYRLPNGRLRVGDPADFLLVDDLRDFQVLETWIGGECVARDGESLLPGVTSARPNRFVPRTVEAGDFALPLRGRLARVIEVEDGQLLTRCGMIAADRIGDVAADVLKIAVVNRYEAAPPAVALVRNVGLRRGAIASTVAHDSHNVVAIGTNDADLARAVNALLEHRGGCVAVDGGEIELLPLPIAGLMSPAPGSEVAAAYSRLTAAARRMGSPLEAPFMTLSFLALLVIPELKLSDRGLFDGRAFEFVPVFSD